MLVFIQNIGILVGYIVSSYLHYKTVGLMAVWLPATCMTLIYFVLPDSPQFLLRNKRENEAEKSMNFYRNNSEKLSLKDAEGLKTEFAEMKKNIAESSGEGNKLRLKDFCEYSLFRGKYYN